MRFASLLLAGSLLLPACTRRAVPAQAPAPAFPKPRTVSTIPINTAPGDTALVFQRTPCYGTCPSYTATVFRDGKVSYLGGRFVPVTGQHTLSLEQPAVMALLEEARRINFAQLAPDYRAQVSDQDGTVITVYLPGQQRHRVAAERGAAPPELQRYITSLGSKLDPLAGINPDK